MFPATIATGPPMVVRLQAETAAKLSKLPFRRASPPTPLTGCDLRRPSTFSLFLRRPECPDFAEPSPRIRPRRRFSHCQRGGTAIRLMQPMSVVVSVEEGRWDMDDIFKNNDFSDNVTFDCVVYYLAGYLARRLSKKTKCELCLSGIKSDGKEIDLPAAQLVNLKTLGFLTHPDNKFYILIKQIEVSFAIHATGTNVFEDTVDHFF